MFNDFIRRKKQGRNRDHAENYRYRLGSSCKIKH